ncbi:TPA: hypothetical protein ACVO0G_004591 [Vibrio diabolicus]
MEISSAAMVGFLAGALPFLKFFHDWVLNRNQFRVKNLEFFYQCFDSEANKARKLVVEQQFKSVFKIRADFDVISLLLLSDKPSKAIELYRYSDCYVEPKNDQFVLKTKYTSSKTRNFERLAKYPRNFFFYMLCAMPSAYSAIWVYTQILAVYSKDRILTLSLLGGLFFVATFAVVLARVAYLKVTDSRSVTCAEELVAIYDKSFQSEVMGVRAMLTRRLRMIRNAWHF